MFIVTDDTHKEGFNSSLLAQKTGLVPDVKKTPLDFDELNRVNMQLLSYLDQQVKRLMLIHNHGDKDVAFNSKSYGMSGGDIT